MEGSLVGEFFEPPPRRQEAGREVRPEWSGPPHGVVPAVVPVEAVVARNERVAIFLNSVQVYPVGFEVVVCVIAREGSGLHVFSDRRDREAEREGRIPPGRLRLGLAFGDGAKASNTSARPFDPGQEEEPSVPLMVPRSGHGGEDEWSETYWVWPLPPPGPLEFVSEWPAADLALSRAPLDSAAIISAAPRARPVFADVEATPDGDAS